MRHRTSLVSLALGASVVGLLSGAAFGRASDVAGCRDTRGGSLGSTTALSSGVGLPAVVGSNTLIDVVAENRRLADVVRTGGGSIVRHLAAATGAGTAYVLDRRGADQVVIVTPARTIRLEQPGEATHPSWSADGRLVWSLGSGLRVWSPRGPSLDISPPEGAVGLFSPVFASEDAIVAVVAEPEPGFTRTEDEGVDNLWRFDLTHHRWARLTDFHARGERWIAIRTPVMRADGSIEFVRISGVSSRTGLPSFGLWRVTRSGEVEEVRALPREMYLAGFLGGRRVWNIFDQASGEWRLYSEVSATTLVDLGCGAVMVDPRSVDDPDRTPWPPRSSTPTVTPTATPTAIPTIAPDPLPTVSPTMAPTPASSGEYLSGILIGDFPSFEAATEAAAKITAAFGERTAVEVVDSITAPNIVRPGVWAAVMLLPDGSDPIASLMTFRQRLPEYQGWSWVVSV